MKRIVSSLKSLLKRQNLNPGPLGPEDSAEHSVDAFDPIWRCLFREQLLSRPLYSNVSVGSRRVMCQRLGQAAIALLLTGTWGPMCAGGTRPSHDRADRRNSAATNKQAGRYIPSRCLPCPRLCVSFPVPSGSYLVMPLEIPLPLCYTGVEFFWRR